MISCYHPIPRQVRQALSATLGRSFDRSVDCLFVCPFGGFFGGSLPIQLTGNTQSESRNAGRAIWLLLSRTFSDVATYRKQNNKLSQAKNAVPCSAGAQPSSLPCSQHRHQALGSPTNDGRIQLGAPPTTNRGLNCLSERNPVPTTAWSTSQSSKFFTTAA